MSTENIKLGKYRNFLKEMFSGCMVSLALCFMLFFYAPLELYFINKNEFWFDINNLLPIVLVTFLVVLLCCVSILVLLYVADQRLYQFGLAVYFIIFICSYIQGNFLVSNLPPLDGTMVDWNQYNPDKLISLALWIVVTLIVVLLIKFMHWEKFYKVLNVVSGCMALIFLLTLVSVCITNEGYKKKLNLYITNEYKFNMSKDTNFIILLFDAMDAGTMTSLLEANPEYKTLFSDFTYYPNMMGSYPFTQHSIPFIFSGEWYENNEPFEVYDTNVYKNAAFFSELEKNSYNMGMYGTMASLRDESICRFENILNGIGGVKSFYEFAKLEIRLTGFKYAPFSLKKYCLFDMNKFNELRVLDDYSLLDWSDLSFYEEINNTDITFTDDKCFKFLHLEGAHVPFQYDRDVNVIEGGTYEDKMEACLTIFKAYLDKLKDNEVYDNSVIIVMSDHGFNGDGTREMTFGRQNPVFFVKGINEGHEMYVSNAPVSFEDLPEAYLRLMNGNNSMEIFDWQEGDQRERRYLFYYYLEENHMVEYMQTGDAADMDTMYPTGREYDYEE